MHPIYWRHELCLSDECHTKGIEYSVGVSLIATTLRSLYHRVRSQAPPRLISYLTQSWCLLTPLKYARHPGLGTRRRRRRKLPGVTSLSLSQSNHSLINCILSRSEGGRITDKIADTSVCLFLFCWIYKNWEKNQDWIQLTLTRRICNFQIVTDII